jgi:hypothetical protein
MGKRLPIRRVAQAVLLLAAVGTMYRAADLPAPGLAIPFLSDSGAGAARVTSELVSARAHTAPPNPQAFAARLDPKPAPRLESSRKAAPAARATIHRRRSPSPRTASALPDPAASPGVAAAAPPAVRPPPARPSGANAQHDPQPEPAARPAAGSTPPVPVPAVPDPASVVPPLPPAPAAPPETPAVPVPPLPAPPLPAVPQIPSVLP